MTIRTTIAAAKIHRYTTKGANERVVSILRNHTMTAYPTAAETTAAITVFVSPGLPGSVNSALLLKSS